ncbi:MAG: serine hydrolase [Bdellovibrionaceae bacterium]|nr:serine hydrolase [Pseudobdellovibrionaceae bacterium]
MSSILRPRYLLILLFVFFLGAFLGASSIFYFLSPSNFSLVDKRQGQTTFINPLLDCQPQRQIGNLQSFETNRELQNLILQLKQNPHILQMAVYYRDLNNGPWFGANEDAIFLPGSLLKIPLMIGYLKLAETNPDILKKSILFDNQQKLRLYDIQGVVPQNKLILGQSYTIEELLHHMIVYSDNVAASLLEENDHHDSLIKTSKEMDIPIKSGVAPYRNLTVKEYAGFFRILYNASYLSRYYSEWALKLIAQSVYQEGMRAGVPPSIQVVRKFGEALGSNGKTLYYNDCGIIYKPDHPYLLCLSIQTSSIKEAQSAAKVLSSFFYIQSGK